MCAIRNIYFCLNQSPDNECIVHLTCANAFTKLAALCKLTSRMICLSIFNLEFGKFDACITTNTYYKR